jgi:hypothetical protein
MTMAQTALRRYIPLGKLVELIGHLPPDTQIGFNQFDFAFIVRDNTGKFLGAVDMGTEEWTEAGAYDGGQAATNP